MDEHAAFPNGSHDDQVDTLAYAVRVAITRAAPALPAAPSPMPAAEREVDFMTTPL